MTKRDRFSLEPRGHHGAHFPLPVMDNDPVKKSCAQLPALGACEVVERGLEPLAEGFETTG
jgi:hypothetical protein